MAGGYVGTGGGNKRVNAIHVGTPLGRKEVSAGYVGTSSGNKQWYSRLGAATLNASAGVNEEYDVVLLTCGDIDQGVQYYFYRTSPGGTVLLQAGFSTYYYDRGRAASTPYSYRLDCVRDGNVLRTSTVSVTTNAAPVPPPPPPPPPSGPHPVHFTYQVWQDRAVESASYEANVASDAPRRVTNGYPVRSTPHAYYGTLDSQRGRQWSQIRFNFPAEVRASSGYPNCTYIHEVELSWYNIHTYWNAGGTVSITLHHNATISNNFWGDTGAVRYGDGSTVKWPTYKPGQINGTTWFSLGGLIVPWNNNSVRETIRTTSVQGFGLVPTSGAAPDSYGYAQGVTEGTITCKITYDVWRMVP